MIYFTKENQK